MALKDVPISPMYLLPPPTFETDAKSEIFFNSALEDCLLGYVRSDLIGSDNVQWNKYNDRKLDKDHLNRLSRSYLYDGVSHRHALPLLIDPVWIQNDVNTLPTKKLANNDSHPVLELSAAGRDALAKKLIVCLAGQHRHISQAKSMKDCIAYLGTAEALNPHDPSEDSRLRQRYTALHTELKEFPFELIDLRECSFNQSDSSCF